MNMVSPQHRLAALALSVIVSTAAAAQSGTTGLAGLRPVENPKVITLDEAFRLAGQRSTDLRVAAARVDASKAQVTQAWAAVLPNISLGADYTFNIPEQTAAFGSAEQSAQQALLFDSIANLTAAQAAALQDPIQRQGALEQAEALRKSANDIRNAEVAEFAIQPSHVVQGNLTVAMPLFNARSIPLLQNAYAGVDIGRLSTRQAQAGVLFGVARAYYQIASTKQLMETVDRQVASTTRQMTRIKQRAEEGYETSLAVARAELEVKKAEQQARVVRAGYRSGKAGLAALLGLVDDFDVVPPPPLAAAEDQDFDNLLLRAWDSRIDLRVQKQLLAIADRGRTDAWFRLLPSFQLVAQGRYTTNTGGFAAQPFTGAVIVQAKLPIFDGGQTMGVIDEANAKITEELLKVRQVEETIERELRGTIDDIAVKEENARTLEEVAELATRTARNAEDFYEAGAATQNDVTDAQLGAFAAEVDAKKARFELETARLGLAYAVGELTAFIKVDDVETAALTSEEEDAARTFMDKVED